jgi:DNA-binding IscR family transcriptional regulator
MMLSVASSPRPGPAPVLSFREGDDALRVAVALAVPREDRSWISTSTCAAQADLSLTRTERALRALTAAGILERRRGRSGGFMLKRSPSDITVGEVLRAATSDSSTSPPAAPTVLEVVMRELAGPLEDYSLATLALRLHA